MLYRILPLLIFLTGALPAFSATVDQAQALYSQGEYEAALSALQDIVRRSPRDGSANYWLGATLMALGRIDEAQAPLTRANERNVIDAPGLLAQIALNNYQPEQASEFIDTWRSRLQRNRRPIPEELEELASRAVRMSNMMQRVEKIQVLDSITLPRDDFFRAYRISSHAGKILPAQSVESMIPAAADITSTAFLPENRTELIWAQADSTNTSKLFCVDILDDGTPENMRPLPGLEGQDMAYPFLMSDGLTLYYADKGENSLGGYDIFLSRRDQSGNFLQPQNIGMPYNSPANDYLLAIDETTGLGWWATDRNAHPDSVTVYVFTPSEVRVNIEANNPALISLARLSDISLTRAPGTDAAAELASRLERLSSESQQSAASALFILPVDANTVYTRLEQFRSPQARSAMTELMGAQAELDRALETLQQMRSRYAAGDRSLSSEILNAEQDIDSMRRRVSSLRNNVLRLERQAH